MTRPLAPFAALALVACASSVHPGPPDAAATDAEHFDDAATEDAATSCTWQWSPAAPMRGLGNIRVQQVRVSRAVTWLVGVVPDGTGDAENSGRFAIAQVVESGAVRRASHEVARTDGATGPWSIATTATDGDVMGILLTAPRHCRLVVLDRQGDVQRDVTVNTLGACQGLRRDVGRWSLHGVAERGGGRTLVRATIDEADSVRAVDLTPLSANDTAFASFAGERSLVAVRRAPDAMTLTAYEANGTASGAPRRIEGAAIDGVRDVRAVATVRGLRAVVWAYDGDRREIALWSAPLDGDSAVVTRVLPAAAEGEWRVSLGDAVGFQWTRAYLDGRSMVLRPDSLATLFDRTYGVTVPVTVGLGKLFAADAGFVALHDDGTLRNPAPHVSWLRCR